MKQKPSLKEIFSPSVRPRGLDLSFLVNPNVPSSIPTDHTSHSVILGPEGKDKGQLGKQKGAMEGLISLKISSEPLFSWSETETNFSKG